MVSVHVVEDQVNYSVQAKWKSFTSRSVAIAKDTVLDLLMIKSCQINTLTVFLISDYTTHLKTCQALHPNYLAI